ncbi:hypothetical protein [Paludisphaera rhizosphaerae]|uniref:hypothetical protein n=1 Tax=Paludisphaera rhizosphaerae TaxID=2711216 RepID=UPI0013E9E7BB|nr:hypothetical protein [Paludisphaera rhizosphaerae]
MAILLLARWAKYPYVDLADPRLITMLISNTVRELTEHWATRDRVVRLPRVDASTSAKTREAVEKWEAVARVPLTTQDRLQHDPGAELEGEDFIGAVLGKLSPDARRLIELVMGGHSYRQAAILLRLSDARLAELLAEAAEVWFACEGDEDD